MESCLQMLLDMFLFALKWFLIVLSPILISIFLHFIYYKFVKKMKREKSEIKYIKMGQLQGNFFYKILILFPRQLILNFFNHKDSMEEYGIWVVAGEQGSGKNLTAAYLCRWFKEKYKKVMVGSNITYDKTDFEIFGFEDFIRAKNGRDGIVALLDEAHLLFNNLGTNAKNFDGDYLAEVCMQRKQSKVCMMLTQQFNRLNIVCRQNTFLLLEPHTIFGCLTIVRKFKLRTAADGQTVEKVPEGMFFFVHTQELYNSYDTYALVDKLGSRGFKEKTTTDNFITVNTEQTDNKKKK